MSISKHTLSLSVLLAASLSTSAVAYEAGNMVIRGGAVLVAPDSSSDDALPGLAGAQTVEADDGTAAGISLTYMLSPQLGVEVLGATPFTHDIKGTGGLNGINVGETKHLPPTVTLQYYVPVADKVKVYGGLGVNYTAFFSEETSGEFTQALDAVLPAVDVQSTDLSLEPSFGFSVSGGIDYQIDPQIGINFGIYWIDIDTEADVKVNGASATKFDVEIDPLVYRLNLVYTL